MYIAPCDACTENPPLVYDASERQTTAPARAIVTEGADCLPVSLVHAL